MGRRRSPGPPLKMDAETMLGQLASILDARLQGYFESMPACGFYDMMRYQLGWKDESLRDTRAWGGKRLRPAICLLSCEAVCGDYSPAMIPAMALELLHNFTLIHDDIEDGDALRRGRPALWRLCGIPQALNVGDGLHSLAKAVLFHEPTDETALAALVQVSREIDAVCLRLCEGQHLDLVYQDSWDVSVGQYLAMIAAKSGALIGCAAYAGAAMATRDELVRQRYREFGEQIGIAFQIRDDLLAIWGEQALTGKPVGDVRKRKKTLPLIFALERSAPEAASRVKRALASDEDCGQAVYELLDATGARQWAIAQAEGYRQASLRALEAAGNRGPAQDALCELAGFSISRCY